MLTSQEIEENKKRFITLLRSTEREGIDKVVDYLEKNNFFQIPSSRHRHHNWRGGLAQHCLGVYDRLNVTGEQLPADSKIITSLLHDICKARKLYYDKNGELKERHSDQLRIPGHGYRSVKLLENLGLKLNPEEKRAIRWHMGGYNIPKEEMRDFFATKKSDLWRLLLNADRFDSSHHDPRTRSSVRK